MFEPDVKAEDVLSKNLFLQDGELIIVEHFEYVNIWWVQHRSQKITREAALQRLKSEPGIRYAEPIRNQVTLRGSIPNDPLFSDQWGMNNTGQSGGTSGADISAARAWQITRGDSWGTHVPVVAVIDDGFQQNHPDLAFLSGGYNAYADNYNVPVANHGTHVTGILGATSNNNTGVAGVMWGTEVFPVAGSSSSETVVVRAYNHILGLRQQYNTSGGSSGRFIVATNSSFGVDEADPEDYPYWCAMYDAMGAAGIISVAATINANVDVDQVGDVPTACDSDYLITVTNTDHNDNRNTGAGYGAETINLGAPGTNIKSTFLTSLGTYGSLSGTSMATPHVTGTIGLMYSALSASQISSSISNPGSLALELKDIILNSVDPNSSLNGITTTGGRLNAYEAVKYALPNQLTNFNFGLFTGKLAAGGIHLYGNNTISSGYTWTITSDRPVVIDGTVSTTGNPSTIKVEGTLIIEANSVLDNVTLQIEDGANLIVRSGVEIDTGESPVVIDGKATFGSGLSLLNATDVTVSSTAEVHFEGSAVLEFMAEPIMPPFLYTSPDFYSAGKTTAASTGTLTMRAASASPAEWAGITLASSSANDSFLRNLVIEDASIGVYLSSVSDVTLDDITIVNPTGI